MNTLGSAEAQKSPFALQMIELISRAKEMDKKCEQFGANKHKYNLNPVISLAKVRDFEQRHRIRLPQGYVDFLTQVGNGGAGPDYGIYSLEEVELENFYDHSNVCCHYTLAKDQPNYYTLPYTIDGKDTMLNSQFTKEKWNKWYNRLEELSDNGNDDGYDAMQVEAYNGLLQIVCSGCEYCIMLICSGDWFGEVSSFSLELSPPYPLHMTFENWMINHFRKVIEKYEKQSI